MKRTGRSFCPLNISVCQSDETYFMFSLLLVGDEKSFWLGLMLQRKARCFQSQGLSSELEKKYKTKTTKPLDES